MSFRFRDLPIKRKLNLLMMSISALVLAISTFSLTYLATLHMERIQLQDLQSIADITARNSQAALMFDDHKAALENLASLRFKPFIVLSILVDSNKNELARYLREGTPQPTAEQLRSEDWLRESKYHQVTRAIELDNEIVGELRIVSDFRGIHATNLTIISTASCILIACLLIAYFVSHSFQYLITRPLNTIISAADHIAQAKDYSARVGMHRKDEFGTLINRFNNMIAEIERRDSNLEKVVADRTLELRDTLEHMRSTNLKLEEQTYHLAIERDKAQEATKVKSAFLANMSHEIRTPLNGILGMTDLLLETELSAEQRELASMAASSGASLLGIVNDVLDFSKIEAGKLGLSLESFDLYDLIFAMEQVLSVPAEKKNLVIVTHIEEQVPRIVRGDSLRIRQILTNLVGNAIKFTPPHGGIFILVEAVSVQLDRAQIRFVVSDSGIGLSEDQQSLVFQAFSQADSSTTRKYGGTGLGLTISSELVRIMGGELKVQSELGRGSVFHFSIECSLPTQDQPVKTAKTEETVRKEGQMRPLSILLAEDNKVNQKLAVALLTKAGHSVKVANDGAEALEYYRRHSFDLILMDIQMPVMSGEEATQQIREDWSGQKIPIIALTAHAMAGDRERYLELGMDDYVAKPIVKAKLFEVIEQTLAKVDAES